MVRRTIISVIAGTNVPERRARALTVLGAV
jgi:hypothetical protein